MKPASLESSGMKFKEESARNRESKCSSLTFVAMEKAASGQKEVFSDLKTPNTCKHTHKYTSCSSLENPEIPHELHYKTALFVGLASFKSVKRAFANKGLAFTERHRQGISAKHHCCSCSLYQIPELVWDMTVNFGT